MIALKKIKYSQILESLKSNSLIVESQVNINEDFTGINSISNANNNELSFFSNDKYLNQLSKTIAKACLIKKEYAQYLPKNCSPIIVSNPYYALACISEIFNNDKNTNLIMSNEIDFKKSKLINQNVKIFPNVTIDSTAIIEEDVSIGSNTNIGPNVIIKKGSTIQDNTSISNTVIGQNCIIQSGCRIGGPGFGFDPETKRKIFHHGNVIIDDDCNIGSNTTIDRAVFESTHIGANSYLDNLIQIAHNVIIGKHAIIAAQVGIAGSTNIGDFIKIGGQAGIAGHLKIGNNVTIAAKSGVTKNIPDNMIVAGFPAKDIKKWKREIISINKIK